MTAIERRTKAIRDQHAAEPPEGYRRLMDVAGFCVGYLCAECGRLSTAKHQEGCAAQLPDASEDRCKHVGPPSASLASGTTRYAKKGVSNNNC
jgi:hypothetical protein